MQATTDLTSTQWQVADVIARQLVLDDADTNELRKTIAYLRAYSEREDAGKKFFDYLNTLARNGNRIGHSKKTQGYLESISETCQQYLGNYKDDVPVMLQVLGWVARLMQYYKEAGPIGELNIVSIGDIPSEAQKIREEKINKLVESENLEVGKQIDAIILGKNQRGSEVTYEISGISFKEKEKKSFDSIPDNGPVIVEIKSLKDNGSINHVKFVRRVD